MPLLQIIHGIIPACAGEPTVITKIHLAEVDIGGCDKRRQSTALMETDPRSSHLQNVLRTSGAKASLRNSETMVLHRRRLDALA